jgi:hypothetical protein
MLDVVKRPERKASKPNHPLNHEFKGDNYVPYFENLSSKELDTEFSKDLKALSAVLSKLSEKDRKYMIVVISRLIDLYIKNKVEKEIESSIIKLIKF